LLADLLNLIQSADGGRLMFTKALLKLPGLFNRGSAGLIDCGLGLTRLILELTRV
jgi:hypothetical protein